MDLNSIFGELGSQDSGKSTRTQLDCLAMISALYFILEKNGLTNAEEFDSICERVKQSEKFKPKYDALNDA